jgi:hypothetical protein
VAILTIQIDPAQAKLMQELLNPKQYQQAIYQATLRTTKSLRTRIAREVKNRSYAKKSDVDKVITAYLPNKVHGTNPVGEIRIKQKQLPLSAFRVRVSKRLGVTAKVGPGLAPITIRHGFKATMPNGKVGIFMRGKKLPSKGPNVGKGKLTKRGFAGRFTINQVFGPSVFSVVSIPEAIDAIAFDSNETMAKNLVSQYERFTKPKVTPPVTGA